MMAIILQFQCESETLYGVGLKCFSGCGVREKSAKSIRTLVTSEQKQNHQGTILLLPTHSSFPSTVKTICSQHLEQYSVTEADYTNKQ